MVSEIELEMFHEEGEDGYVFLQPLNKNFFETTGVEMSIIDKAEAQLLYADRDDRPDHPEQGEKAVFGTVKYNSEAGIVSYESPGESNAGGDTT